MVAAAEGGPSLFGSLSLEPLLFLGAVTATVSAVLSLLPQVLLHLPQRVQTALDLLIGSWTRGVAAPPWGQLVPWGLSLGFRCTLAQVCQDAQGFLLPLLRETEDVKVRTGSMFPLREPRFLRRQNQTFSQQSLSGADSTSCSG